MADTDASVVVRLESALRAGGGENAWVQFSGPQENVKREVGKFFHMAPGAMEAPLGDVLASGAQAWIKLMEQFKSLGAVAEATAAMLETFPGAAVVNESTGRPISEGPVGSAGGEHKHQAYVDELERAATADAVKKLGVAYGKLPDADPALLERIRGRWAALHQSELDAGRGK